jgi:uncharacterized membrane protein YraQ (UPF0718 family)
MVWYLIGGITLAVALGLMFFTFIRDRRYERRRVLDAMSPELRDEIEDERAEAMERRDRFRGALDEAMSEERDKAAPPQDAVP